MKRIKVTGWLDPETARAVRDLAAAHQLTLSEIIAALLKQAVRDHAAEAGANLLVAELRRAIRSETRAAANRLANLLARTSLEAAAARRELFNLLIRLSDAPTARAIHDGAWKAAVDSLRQPIAAALSAAVAGDSSVTEQPETSDDH